MIRIVASGVAALVISAAPVASSTPAADPVIAIENALARTTAADFAIFDADGTLWSSDIEESGIAFFEEHGWLSVDRLPPELRPLPPERGETLFGYYKRLCDFDDKLCLPWSAQVFAGQPLGVLARRVDALFASDRPIPVRYRRDGRLVEETIPPPRIYAGQRALIGWLRARGVRVYVVTASHEELVRLVVSNPRYGLDIPPERVVGVTTLLHAPDGSVSTARGDIEHGHAAATGYWSHRESLVPGTTLWSPLPWQEGKVAAIQAYVHAVRRPVLVAGDSASDWPMLFYSGGVRLWVNHNEQATARLHRARTVRAGEERAVGARSTENGWVEAVPAVLGRDVGTAR